MKRARTQAQVGRGSRRKGASGEREAAAAWTEATGVEWERTIGQSRRGGGEVPDIHSCRGPRHPTTRLHVEVKRGKRVSIHAAMAQAVEDAEARRALPVVSSRRDRESWLVTVRLDDLMALVKALS